MDDPDRPTSPASRRSTARWPGRRLYGRLGTPAALLGLLLMAVVPPPALRPAEAPTPKPAPAAGLTPPPPADFEPPPGLAVPFTTNAPAIDGRLDDAAWTQAVVLTNFTQVLPREGEPPTERTEIRLLFDRKNLYLAARCYDSNPRAVLAKQLRHDGSFVSDDNVAFVLDPFRQRREGYFFMVNPAGARTDGLVENYERPNLLWDTIWHAKARVDEAGWTAEIRLPFSSLSFDPRSEAWGFNVQRTIRRKQEQDRWTGISRSRDLAYLPGAGEIHGLTDLRQGLGLEVRPGAVLRYRRPADGSGDWEFRPSLDATYHITPSLKANATVNTDFAEAEVDERLVNLTRFPLFFPEKRDFFLQDASLFVFGGLHSSSILPYYSRRIGLDAHGAPVDIVAGGRLTGRLNGASLALLDVQQEGYDGVSSKNLFVGRASTRVFGESNVGALITHGDPRSPGDNTLLGLDFNYLNEDLGNDKSLRGNLWAMGTDSDRAGGRGHAFGGDLDFPNEPLDLHLFFREIGEDFDPALGFVRRHGIRQYIGSARYVWRPNTRWVRSVSLGMRPIWTTDLDNRLIAEDHDLPYVLVYTPQLDRVLAFYTYNRDVLDEPFDIHDGIAIPPDDYLNDEASIGFFASDARPVGLDFSFRAGHYYGGTRLKYEGMLDLRPIPQVRAKLGYELNQIDLPEGAFNVRIATARLSLALSPDLTWSNLAQYDNISGNFGINSRIRWTWRPGYDLYFVVNQGYFFSSWDFQEQNTDITLKAVASIRF